MHYIDDPGRELAWLDRRHHTGTHISTVLTMKLGERYRRLDRRLRETHYGQAILEYESSRQQEAPQGM